MKLRKRDIWNDVTRRLEGASRVHLPLAGESPGRIEVNREIRGVSRKIHPGPAQIGWARTPWAKTPGWAR